MKQDLRDKLLKAGLVNKKAKKRADHRARVKRTEDQKKGVDSDADLEQKAREYEEKEEKRRRQDKERELARHQEQQKREAERAQKKTQKKDDSEEIHRKNLQSRARDLLQASMFTPKAPGPVAFNFVARSGGIRKIQVSTGIAHDLRSGQLAIAQLPGGERFGLVRRDVAEQLLADDPSLVRFFVSDPEKDMVETPLVVEEEPPKKKSAKRFEPPGKSGRDRRDR